MSILHIEDPADPRLAIYRSLKATNETRGQPLFVVEGEKLLDALLASRFPVESALANERTADRIAAKMPPGVPVYVLPGPRIGEVVGYNFHQGVLGCGRQIDGPSLDEILGRPSCSTLVVLPEIHNPENLGSIVRSADVFGVDAIVAGPTCPDPLSRRVLRVSMGTALALPVAVEGDIASTLAACRERHGFRLVATVTDPDAEPLESFAAHRPERIALMLGTEAHGLADRWREMADHVVTIPMRAGAESLNVSIATGILLYRLASPLKLNKNPVS
jgi:tRNA G18 (ribose-2'-O)-methylase SpoU